MSSKSKRKSSRKQMSDSDEYPSSKVPKESKAHKSQNKHDRNEEDYLLKKHKKLKKISRKSDSEDSGRESDSRTRSRSSRSHKTSKTKDERYKEYQRKERKGDFESDENYSQSKRKYNKENMELSSEDRFVESRYQKKNDEQTSEKIQNADKHKHKRKHKNRDMENEYKSKDREKNHKNKDRKSDFKNKYDENKNESRKRHNEPKDKDWEKVNRNNDRQDKNNYKHRVRDNEKYQQNTGSSRSPNYNSNYEEEPPFTRAKKRTHNSMENSNENLDDDSGNKKPNMEKESSKRVDNVEPLSKRQKIDTINMRTGGAYIPPARLRMMQEKIQDKGSEEYQRLAWEALKKSIVGMTNKINSSNIAEIVPELFKENIIRGRGVLSRAIMQAQAASPTFTRVYAALVAIINSKFPQIGELILKRLIIQYKRGFRRNDKTVCMTAARFLAHLLNQEVAHEVLILEIITHLLENPTEDSVEIAIATLKECGRKLTELTSKGIRAITQRVRDVLQEGTLNMRAQYMIEVFFAVQKDGYKDYVTISPELDLVEEDDKYTHLVNLDDAVVGQEMLNVFKFDPEYQENEEKYKDVVKEILGDSSDEEDSGDESDDEEEEDGAEGGKGDESQQIIDMTETNIVCLRRKIYLTVQSSLDFEECAHKLLKLELKPGQILEMCYMILDCCAQQRTYEKFFGLLAQRFCQMSKVYVEPFTEIFDNSYKTIHRLETNKLRNVAKFFAHLLYTDAISWMVLSNIKLNEEDTTSSSRIFIKILFQELCEYMGLSKLNDRVKDITLQEAFEGLFPRDHPHNTRFAINFFTSIGLGGLTDELREHLKNLPKNPPPIEQNTAASPKESSSSSDSSSSSSSSESSSTSSSSSSDSSSDSEESNSKHKNRSKQKRK